MPVLMNLIPSICRLPDDDASLAQLHQWAETVADSFPQNVQETPLLRTCRRTTQRLVLAAVPLPVNANLSVMTVAPVLPAVVTTDCLHTQPKRFCLQ